MRLGAKPGVLADAVDEKPQSSLGAEFRIEQPNRPGRTVPRVLERLFAPFGLHLVEFDEVGVRDVRLAADFKHRGNVIADQLQRAIDHRPHIVRHVVADPAVAAGRPLHEQTVLIAQSHGHAVDFQLDDPLDRLARQQLGRLLGVGSELFEIVGVIDRQHRHAMLDRIEFVDRGVADASRRTVGRRQLRINRFELPQSIEQLVVLAVRDRRRGEHIVAAIVLADLAAESLDFCRVFALRHGQSVSSGVFGSFALRAQ